MRIDVFGLVEGVYAGSAERVISQSFIQRVLLDFEVGSDSILHKVDLLGLNGLYLGKDVLETISVGFNHVIIPATDSAVLLFEWFGRLL